MRGRAGGVSGKVGNDHLRCALEGRERAAPQIPIGMIQSSSVRDDAAGKAAARTNLD
jgi:hypothetical protein